MTCSSVGASALGSAGHSHMRERMFQKLDADGSGTVDETEFTKGPDDSSGMDSGIASALFKAFDTDGDGALTQDELDTGFQKLSSSMRSVLIGNQEQGGPDSAGGPPPLPGADSGSSGDNGLDPLLSMLQQTDSDTGGKDDTSSDSDTSASTAVRNDFKQLLSDLQKLTESGSAVGTSVSV